MLVRKSIVGVYIIVMSKEERVRHQPDECCNKTNKEEVKEESEMANLAASFDTEYSEVKEE